MIAGLAWAMIYDYVTVVASILQLQHAARLEAETAFPFASSTSGSCQQQDNIPRSSSPDVLAHTLYPVAKLIDAGVPLL